MSCTECRNITLLHIWTDNSKITNRKINIYFHTTEDLGRSLEIRGIVKQKPLKYRNHQWQQHLCTVIERGLMIPCQWDILINLVQEYSVGWCWLFLTPECSLYLCSECIWKAITFTQKPTLIHEQEYFRPQISSFGSILCIMMPKFTILWIHERSMRLHIL